ncbi:hypothetical protein GF312_02465, partial [Candidatus Poribacteria bacterium]|nr:hypothetical protein [Candidatus Poribacteria bacterium]
MNRKNNRRFGMSDKIDSMLDGLGIDKDELLSLSGIDLDKYKLTSPFPASGRYKRHIEFLEYITSLEALYKFRVQVIVEYFIALADTMSKYQGKFSHQKIIPFPLTDSMKSKLRNISPELSYKQIAQIEAIEKKSDHDTAAITDWVKFVVDHQDIMGFSKAPEEDRQGYENSLDGFHFGRTSEDVNSPVFALINRRLFFEYVIPEIISFQEMIMEYAQEFNTATAGLTHGQPAEPTTISKQLMNTVAAVDHVLRQVFLPYDENGNQNTIAFPVKTFGAVGNNSDLKSAYPDINWIENDQRFVKALGKGFYLDYMSTQASLYGQYKLIYDAVCTISRHIIKFIRDFWGWTSFQWFKKRRKKGVKGSSVMPNKYNPWRMEGAGKILEKFIVQLEYTSKALIDYPYEGDMGRSIVMRDIGDDFAKFFIAIGRIKEELRLYEVNKEKIEKFLHENPGLVGGAAQTILKRSQIPGDAYRHIQEIMINPDGSYVTSSKFAEKLREKIKSGDIPDEVGNEILEKANVQNNTGYADELADTAMETAME